MANVRVGWNPQKTATTRIRRMVDKAYETRTPIRDRILDSPLEREDPSSTKKPEESPLPIIENKDMWYADKDPGGGPPGDPGPGPSMSGADLAEHGMTNTQIGLLAAKALSSPILGPLSFFKNTIDMHRNEPLQKAITDIETGVPAFGAHGTGGQMGGVEAANLGVSQAPNASPDPANALNQAPTQTESVDLEALQAKIDAFEAEESQAQSTGGGGFEGTGGQMGDPAAAGLGVSGAPGASPDPGNAFGGGFGVGVGGGDSPGVGGAAGTGGSMGDAAAGLGVSGAPGAPGDPAGIGIGVGAGEGEGDGACIIVTACTSKDSPEVNITREYRDTFLDSETLSGYYLIAAFVVPVIKKFAIVKWAVRVTLVERLVDFAAYSLGKREATEYRTSKFVAQRFLRLCSIAGRFVGWIAKSSRITTLTEERKNDL